MKLRVIIRRNLSISQAPEGKGSEPVSFAVSGFVLSISLLPDA